MGNKENLKILITAKDKASKTVDKLTKNVSKNTSVLNKRVGEVGKYSALAMGAAAGAMLKFAADFDESVRKVNVMAKRGQEGFEDMKKGILDLSDDYAISAEKMSDAMYNVVSAGYRGEESMEVLEVVAKGAAGGMADVQVTAAAVTKSLNIFGMEGEDAGRVMDTFFGIVDQGLLTFEQLATSFPRAAEQAGVLGISLEEVGATLAVVSKTAGSVEQGATAINSTFTALTKPSAAMKQLFRDIGYESAQAAIKEEGFANILREVKKRAGGSAEELSKLFKNKRALRAILPIVTTQAESFEEAMSELEDTSGNTNEAFKEMAEGPAFKMAQAMNKLKNAGIALGGELFFVAEALSVLVDKVVPVIKGVQVLGPALGKLGYKSEQLGTSLELFITEKLADAEESIAGAESEFNSFRKAEESLTNQFIFQQDVIDNLDKDIVELTKDFMDMGDSNKTATERAKESREQMDKMTKALQETGDQAQSTGDDLSKSMKEAVGAMQEVRKEIKGIYQDMTDSAKSYEQRVQEIEKEKNQEIVDEAFNAERDIKELRNRRAEALAREDREEVQRLNSKISRKKQIIKQFEENYSSLQDRLNEKRKIQAMNEIQRTEYMYEKKQLMAKRDFLQEKVQHMKRLVRRLKEKNAIIEYIGEEKEARLKAEVEKTKTFRDELSKQTNELDSWVETQKGKYQSYVNSVNSILSRISSPSGGGGLSPNISNPYSDYVDDALITSGGDVIKLNPNDNVLAFQGNPSRTENKKNITINISGNTLLDDEAGERIGNELVEKLKYHLDL